VPQCLELCKERKRQLICPGVSEKRRFYTAISIGFLLFSEKQCRRIVSPALQWERYFCKGGEM
jgi:hypothetical protein